MLLREVFLITQDTQEKIYRWGKGVSSFLFERVMITRDRRDVKK